MHRAGVDHDLGRRVDPLRRGRLLRLRRVVPGVAGLGEHLTGTGVEDHGRAEVRVDRLHPVRQQLLDLVLDVAVDGQLQLIQHLLGRMAVHFVQNADIFEADEFCHAIKLPGTRGAIFYSRLAW